MSIGAMQDAASFRRIAVVVPAYNEAAVIGDVVAELTSTFGFVCVADDGSRDATPILARQAGAHVVSHAINLGQGAALKTGLVESLRRTSADWLVTFDADGQHRVEDAIALVERAGKGDVDVVLGTRFGGLPVEAGPVRRLVLKTAVILTRLETGLPLTDTHNGLRALSRKFAEGLELNDRGMGHASEILRHVKRSEARWAEVPVQVRYTDYSRGKGQSLVNSVNIVFDSMVR